MSINEVTLIGNLGADPEARTTSDGRLVVNFRLATSEKWKDKVTGEQKSKTEWHSVAIFNEVLARVAQQYLKKGSQVYIRGKLQTNRWEKDGVEKTSTEIVLQGYQAAIELLARKPQANAAGDDNNNEFDPF